MKKRLLLFVEFYFLFVVLFVLCKPVFMLYNHSIYHTASFVDYLSVMWHGLPLDLSVAGYVTALPGLLLILSAFMPMRTLQFVFKGYLMLLSLFLPLIFVVDMVLYAYWGFRLDSTPLFYFFSSPKDAIASVSIWFVLLGVVVSAVLVVLLYLLLRRLFLRIPLQRPEGRRRYIIAGVMLLCTAFLFLPIRGGITVSTMNVGKVYFCSNQQLNHAAINPCFSLLSSLWGGINTDGYHYMDDKVADRLLAQIIDTSDAGSGTQSLLRTRRPNVIVVILESFSAKIMKTLGGIPVAVNMDRLGQEGILFTNFYANSFRTDRGVASILAGYPAQPSMSIMKYPQKSETLPMFPRVMKEAGYDLCYYYGGDADFTNMRSFLATAGFDRIISDRDFPLSQRISKWGAPDGEVFKRLLTDLGLGAYRQPFLRIVQTSSSHEPYDVPYHKLQDPRLNAFAYADSCLGAFVDKLRTTPLWSNTLIIMVPDHLGVYPGDIDNYGFDRYHIPLIFAGGALRQSMQIPTYASQIDIAATLLSQLGLSHRRFTFSKDIMNPRSPHFGFSTFPNAFGMVSPYDSVFFNCDTRQVIHEKGCRKGLLLPYGKALLQKLYQDIAKR